MAEASDSCSAPSAQRQKPQIPVPYAAAPSGAVSPGRRNLLGALAVAPLAVVAPASADDIGDHPDIELLRLGAECMLALRDWNNAENGEPDAICERRYWDTLERFEDLSATTPAGLAMQLRIQFMQQCGNPWNGEAALAMELTGEQLAEIDGLDMQIFRLAQTAMRISGGRA